MIILEPLLTIIHGSRVELALHFSRDRDPRYSRDAYLFTDIYEFGLVIARYRGIIYQGYSN